MNKLLKSPIFVTILVIVAIVVMYTNLIQPIISDRKKKQIVETSDIAVKNDPIDEDLEYNENEELPISQLTYDYTALSQIGWNTTWDRDPFFVNKRSIVKHVEPTKTKGFYKKANTQENISTEAIVIGLKKSMILYRGNKYQQGDRLLGGIIVGFNSEFIDLKYGDKRVKVKCND